MTPPGPLLGHDGDTIVLDSDTEVVVADRSCVHITCLHDARPLIRCSGRSEVRIETRDRSAPTITASDRSSVRLDALGASAANLVGDDWADVFVRARDRSGPTISAFDASQLRLVVEDDAAPRCHDWPPGWQARRSEVYVGQRVDEIFTADEAEAAARAFYEEWLRCRNRVSAARRTRSAIPMLCAGAVDVRWSNGTVHLELVPPGDVSGASWFSHDAHDPHPFTEASRVGCTKVAL